MRDRSTPLTDAGADALGWDRTDGLLPAVVQDADTLQVLMLGYMSRDALAETFRSGLVTFHSRSKGRLWRKGETSGNVLALDAVYADCDADALLVKARPAGPTCHRGTTSCFAEADAPGVGYLGLLSRVVSSRARDADPDSYTARLLGEGLPRIAQKVGEEGVELALAAVTRDAQGCTEELADLLYHVAVLMEAKGVEWDAVRTVLADRHRQASS